MRNLLFLLFLVASGTGGQDQGRSERTGASHPGAPTVIASSSGGYCIPDPNSKASALTLATNRSFAQALGLTEVQQKGLAELLRKHGPLTGLVLTREQAETLSGPDKSLLLAAHEKRIEQDLDEVLTPEQSKRLPQLVYQTEIARLGLGEAITDGRLARDVGVTENQKSNLRIKAARAEEKVAAALQKARAEAQAEILAELSTEQRKKAEVLLGEPYFFRDDLFRLLQRPPVRPADR